MTLIAHAFLAADLAIKERKYKKLYDKVYDGWDADDGKATLRKKLEKMSAKVEKAEKRMENLHAIEKRMDFLEKKATPLALEKMIVMGICRGLVWPLEKAQNEEETKEAIEREQAQKRADLEENAAKIREERKAESVNRIAAFMERDKIAKFETAINGATMIDPPATNEQGQTSYRMINPQTTAEGTEYLIIFRQKAPKKATMYLYDPKGQSGYKIVEISSEYGIGDVENLIIERSSDLLEKAKQAELRQKEAEQTPTTLTAVHARVVEKAK